MISDLIWEGRFSQPQKAQSPIFVTLFGILMLVSDLHPKKAQSPIFVTLFGILILFSDSHLQNVQNSIFVTLFGILILVRDLHNSYLLLVDYQYYTL